MRQDDMEPTRQRRLDLTRIWDTDMSPVLRAQHGRHVAFLNRHRVEPSCYVDPLNCLPPKSTVLRMS